MLLRLLLLSFVFSFLWGSVLGIGYLITTINRDAVIQDMLTAATRGDTLTLERRIAWDDLRANVKDDLKQAKENQAEAVGNIGPPISRIDELVDYYIQPENLDFLLVLKQSVYPHIQYSAFIHRDGFDPVLGFYVDVGPARDENAADSNLPSFADRTRVRLYFTVEDGRWMITNMHVPMFMVPTRIIPKQVLQNKLEGMQ